MKYLVQKLFPAIFRRKKEEEKSYLSTKPKGGGGEGLKALVDCPLQKDFFYDRAIMALALPPKLQTLGNLTEKVLKMSSSFE